MGSKESSKGGEEKESSCSKGICAGRCLGWKRLEDVSILRDKRNEIKDTGNRRND